MMILNLTIFYMYINCLVGSRRYYGAHETTEDDKESMRPTTGEDKESLMATVENEESVKATLEDEKSLNNTAEVKEA